MEEIWHDIEGYEGLYQISNKGRVKSLYKGSERILRPGWTTGGYLFVVLCKNGNKKKLKIHRLVAEAFIPYTGLNPDSTEIKGRIEINHKSEIKTDNRVENLEWCDRQYNNNYGTHNEKLSRKILQYSKSGEFIKEWPSALEVNRVLGINNSHIIQCCKGKRKSAGGFVWRYKEERTE